MKSFLTCFSNFFIWYSIRKLAPKPKKILQLFRLRQLHNAVFVKLNKATWNMIKMVEPFITYGYPSRQTISKLIYKRGCGKVQRRRLPLTDNSIIEGELGKHGIACVEDLIHEVVTCGPKFKEANNFLWPFKLSSPLGGFEIKRHSFAQGFGAFGNREELINSVVKKMIWGLLTLWELEADLQTTNEEMLTWTYLDSEINEREHWLHKYPL